MSVLLPHTRVLNLGSLGAFYEKKRLILIVSSMNPAKINRPYTISSTNPFQNNTTIVNVCIPIWE